MMPAPHIVVAGPSAGIDAVHFTDALRRLEPTAEITALSAVRTARLRDAVHAAGAALDRAHAEVVVGFGGGPALPAYLAARRRRLPIVVCESGSRPGLASRAAARVTRHVFTVVPGARLAHAMPLRGERAGDTLARYVLIAVIAERRRIASVTAEQGGLAS